MPDNLIIPPWADDPIGRRWWDFHCRHPEVYGALLNLCDEWTEARPNTPVSIKMLWERLRWEHAVGNLGGPGWKLNNSHTSLYARYIMEKCPRFTGLFRLRARHGEASAIQKPNRPWRLSDFTAYHGCAHTTCRHRAECLGSGDCAEPALPVEWPELQSPAYCDECGDGAHRWSDGTYVIAHRYHCSERPTREVDR